MPTRCRRVRFVCEVLRTALALLAGACGEDGTAPPEDGPTDWQAALETITEADAHYAYAYVGTAPDDRMLQVEIGQAAHACGSAQPATPQREWKLTLLVGTTEPGTYPVDAWGDGPGSHVRAVLTSHQGDDELRQYEAIAGSAELEAAAATLEEWREGSPAVLSFALEFPRQPLQQRGCSEGVDRMTGDVTSFCTCEDEDGVETQCVPQAAGEQCCLEETDDVHPFSGSLRATPCPELCSWSGPQSLEGLCDQLRL